MPYFTDEQVAVLDRKLSELAVKTNLIQKNMVNVQESYTDLLWFAVGMSDGVDLEKAFSNLLTLMFTTGNPVGENLLQWGKDLGLVPGREQ